MKSTQQQPLGPLAVDARLLEQVEQIMRRVIGDDVVGRMAQEHLGTGGKRLRARLALWAATVWGGDRQAAAMWAAACELAHNATLVHDDLQDGDRVRRGQPTTWVRYGAAQAINVGDLLFMAPTLALAGGTLSDATRWRLAEAVARHVANVVRGQAQEFALRTERCLERDAYFAAIIGKTSGLFQLPVEGAALLTGATNERAAAMAEPFQHLGVLFQLQDDVLDLYGAKGRDAVGADLREGKISAFVVEHVACRPHEREALLTLLERERDQTTQAEVDVWIARFRDSGALRAVLKHIEVAAERAVQKSRALDPALGTMMEAWGALLLEPIQDVRE